MTAPWGGLVRTLIWMGHVLAIWQYSFLRSVEYWKGQNKKKKKRTVKSQYKVLCISFTKTKAIKLSKAERMWLQAQWSETPAAWRPFIWTTAIKPEKHLVTSAFGLKQKGLKREAWNFGHTNKQNKRSYYFKLYQCTTVYLTSQNELEPKDGSSVQHFPKDLQWRQCDAIWQSVGSPTAKIILASHSGTDSP